jgi:hypothetical protein
MAGSCENGNKFSGSTLQAVRKLFPDFIFYCSQLLEVTLTKHVPIGRPIEKVL